MFAVAAISFETFPSRRRTPKFAAKSTGVDAIAGERRTPTPTLNVDKIVGSVKRNEVERLDVGARFRGNVKSRVYPPPLQASIFKVSSASNAFDSKSSNV